MPASASPARRRSSRQAAALTLLLVATQSLIPAGAQSVPWATSLAPAVQAQPLPEDRGADGLAQSLAKLRTWASLLMIVAHPDDEDGGMMAYESRGAGARTALLTLTRGEGGQNAMSGESYDALGLVRTQELLAADRYSGTEQIWGTEADYGFSKTKDEAFAQWGHDRVLRDVVRAVREQRPLVLCSVFLGAVTDGHGHHQVAGQMAQEAFNAAGDPDVFPDQIAAGLRPWKPLAVFGRVPFAPVTGKGMYDYATDTWAPTSFTNYVTGEHFATAPTADVSIPEGMFDPVLGRSYLQMAREGWGLQKSQYGGGNPPLAGPDSVEYHRFGSRVVPADAKASDPGSTGFFTGIDTSLPGMALLAHPVTGDASFVRAGLERIDHAATHAFLAYTPAMPARIAPDLREGYLATQALLAEVASSNLTTDSKADLTHELRIKLVQFNTALVEALGLHLDALLTPAPERDLRGAKPRAFGLYPELTRTHVTPGEPFDVRLHVTAAEPWSATGELALERTGLATPSGEHWEVTRTEAPGLNRAQSGVGEAIFAVTVPRNAAPTAPYFSRPSIAQPFYDVADPSLLGQSTAPYPVSGFADFRYQGVPLHVAEVAQGVERQHGPGTLMTPLVVTPGLSVTLPEAVAILPSGRQELRVEVGVANEAAAEPADATLALHAPAGWLVEPAVATRTLQPGEQASQQFTVRAPAGKPGQATLQATARTGNTEYTSGFATAGYSGLVPTNLYRPATLVVRPVEVAVSPGTRIGYVMGTGDEVPAALRALGCTVDLLTAADLQHWDLAGYGTIVLGVRTYTAVPALGAASPALQRFAAAGGTVVVQYQSGDFPGAPLPLQLGSSPARVVDEHAPVALLNSHDPLLTTPNRISPADFDGWVEERGHGFAASWAAGWTPLLATADPGQDVQQGGLLVTSVGRGRYVYVALALYRQLTEGVPGAYRLLANLVSQGNPRPQ
ncbi:PIG-L family deacetylase [Acidipila sp. EB88]|uniref:PIG-L family deacetylase n=1 Tax=Acidipila sp. EB88 TaxID=2305226 RepID=UPI00131549EE|nr:PIG-L family deacetylase [Acidipila sp. EB88]